MGIKGQREGRGRGIEGQGQGEGEGEIPAQPALEIASFQNDIFFLLSREGFEAYLEVLVAYSWLCSSITSESA